MTAIDRIFAETSRRIENELRAKGEVMLPGHPDFDALTAQIEINRNDRDAYERAVSTPIRHWTLR